MSRRNLASLGVRVVCRVHHWPLALLLHGKPPMGVRWLVSTWRRGAR